MDHRRNKNGSERLLHLKHIENTTYQSLWNTEKILLTGVFTTLHLYILEKKTKNQLHQFPSQEIIKNEQQINPYKA